MKFYNIKTLISDVNTNKGFTLIEVLVATVIMSIVVTLAGTAFVAILQQNQKAESESERRTYLNRALDYMANEVRMANLIADTSSNMPSNATRVIRLTIPSDSTHPTHEYYIRTSDNSSSCNSSSSIWECPYSIYRRLITSGGDTTDHRLVDGIKAPQRSGNPLSCPNGTTWDSVSSTCIPVCATGSTLSGGNGFYACIYSGGKKVDLYLYGKLSDSTNETLEVKSTVYTRSN